MKCLPMSVTSSATAKLYVENHRAHEMIAYVSKSVQVNSACGIIMCK